MVYSIKMKNNCIQKINVVELSCAKSEEESDHYGFLSINLRVFVFSHHFETKVSTVK